jgi:methionyl-tRNA formyltransferase
MDEGLDTGPVLARETIAIGPEENAGELAARISELAARVVRDYLERAVRGDLPPEPQDAALASTAPPIEPRHRRVDFAQSAEAVTNLVRGMTPTPGAFTTVGAKRLRLGRVRPLVETPAGTPGTVTTAAGTPRVATGQGSIEILAAQLEGKREVSGRDLVNGRVLTEGSILGVSTG